MNIPYFIFALLSLVTGIGFLFLWHSIKDDDDDSGLARETARDVKLSGIIAIIIAVITFITKLL